MRTKQIDTLVEARLSNSLIDIVTHKRLLISLYSEDILFASFYIPTTICNWKGTIVAIEGINHLMYVEEFSIQGVNDITVPNNLLTGLKSYSIMAIDKESKVFKDVYTLIQTCILTHFTIFRLTQDITLVYDGEWYSFNDAKIKSIKTVLYEILGEYIYFAERGEPLFKAITKSRAVKTPITVSNITTTYYELNPYHYDNVKCINNKFYIELSETQFISLKYVKEKFLLDINASIIGKLLNS